MSFNEQTIKTIANLARLRFPKEDEEKFMNDINGLSYGRFKGSGIR